MPDAFADKAAAWDDNPVRVAVARAFFEAALPLAGAAVSGRVLDFGSGTGLLGLLFAGVARRVDLADTSPAMVQVLREKIAAQGLANVHAHLGELDELTGPDLPAGGFDLVVSLNALHHIPDIPGALAGLFALAAPGAHVLVADLMAEDGSFHAPEQVPHNGFDPDDLARRFEDAGFEAVAARPHHVIRKPDAMGALRDYPQFLLHAHKR